MQYEQVLSEQVFQYLQSLNLSTRGSEKDRADRLDAYFKAQILKGEEILVCDVCDGHSPASLSDCPFCGESGEDFTRTKPISEVEDGVQEKTVYYVDDLNRIQREIYKAKKKANASLHRIGKLLGVVRRHSLWRLRRIRGSNSQQYGSFAKWVSAEGYFSHGSSQRLIALAEKLTPGELAEVLSELPACVRTWDLKNRLGLGKDFNFLGIGSGKTCKKPIVRYAEKDGYHIEIDHPRDPDERISVELEQEDGTVEIVHPRESTFLTHPAQRYIRPMRPENRMERVDFNIGIAREKMWKRNTSGVLEGSAARQPARELNDDPWFELPLNEAVKIVVRVIRNLSGELEVVCETRRN